MQRAEAGRFKKSLQQPNSFVRRLPQQNRPKAVIALYQMLQERMAFWPLQIPHLSRYDAVA